MTISENLPPPGGPSAPMTMPPPPAAPLPPAGPMLPTSAPRVTPAVAPTPTLAPTLAPARSQPAAQAVPAAAFEIEARPAPRKSAKLWPFVLVMSLLFAVIGTATFIGYQHLQSKEAEEEAAAAAPSTEGGAEAPPPIQAEAVDGASTTVAGAAPVIGLQPATLPDATYPRPPYRNAVFIETTSGLDKVDGNIVDYTTTATVDVDYETPIARLLLEQSGNDAQSNELVVTADSMYAPGQAFGAPWTRKPLSSAAAWTTGMYSKEYLPMYQDFVNAEVRAAATEVTVQDELVHDVPVTTYRFNVDMTKVPSVFGATDVGEVATLLNSNLLTVRVTMSVDADGLLRVVDFQWDDATFRSVLTMSAEVETAPLHVRTEVVSTSDQPNGVTPPAVFVDALPEG